MIGTSIMKKLSIECSAVVSRENYTCKSYILIGKNSQIFDGEKSPKPGSMLNWRKQRKILFAYIQKNDVSNHYCKNLLVNIKDVIKQ